MNKKRIVVIGATSAIAEHCCRLWVQRGPVELILVARNVALAAIHPHGGIDMTEEYAVGHSLRRIHVLDQMFGDADAHAARLAAALL